ncbi:Uncharacterised protein [Vibrio cholerae]|nr:Uncharacterised protein [Vibrio cholerae]
MSLPGQPIVNELIIVQKKRPFPVAQLCCSNIPFLLEAAAVLATFAPPFT